MSKRSRIKAASAAVALGTLGSMLLAPAPAESLSPYQPGLIKQVTMTLNNGVSRGNCQLTIKAVNQANGTVNVQIAAQAVPTTLAGYTQNVKTTIYCYIVPGFATLYREGNASIALDRVSSTIALAPNYFICGELITTTKTAGTFSNFNCKS